MQFVQLRAHQLARKVRTQIEHKLSEKFYRENTTLTAEYIEMATAT